jgi:hypothetical protein
MDWGWDLPTYSWYSGITTRKLGMYLNRRRAIDPMDLGVLASMLQVDEEDLWEPPL